MDEIVHLQESLLTETIVENTINELKQMNLSAKDYVNIANALLDLAINTNKNGNERKINYRDEKKIDFPIQYEEVVIEKFNPKKHKKLFEQWTGNDYGREFLLSRLDNVERNPEEIIKDDSNILGIIETPDKTPIGIMGYLHYDKLNNKAELRKLIGNRDYSGKGFGKKATKAWISYGVNNLKLRKIYIYTFDTNLRNIRINRELGFNLEGIFKAENVYNGVPKDILRMTLVSK